MNKIVALFTLTFALIVGGCSSLMLQPANFSWAAEEILDVNNGMVSAQRYSVEFNVKPMLAKEFGSDSAMARNTKIVRVIRDKAGFYFVTAPKFKNVYVFSQGEGMLSLANTIVVSPDKPMDDPKFNQRNTYIELLNGSSKMQLTKAGNMQGGGR